MRSGVLKYIVVACLREKKIRCLRLRQLGPAHMHLHAYKQTPDTRARTSEPSWQKQKPNLLYSGLKTGRESLKTE